MDGRERGGQPDCQLGTRAGRLKVNPDQLRGDVRDVAVNGGDADRSAMREQRILKHRNLGFLGRKCAVGEKVITALFLEGDKAVRDCSVQSVIPQGHSID